MALKEVEGDDQIAISPQRPEGGCPRGLLSLDVLDLHVGLLSIEEFVSL